MTRRRVALFLESSRGYGRQLLAGVSRFVRERGTWSVAFRPRGLADPPPAWLAGWRGDGVLVRTDNARLLDAVRRLGVPAVDLRLKTAAPALPAVGIDNRAVAELAARHLLDRGLRSFGFVGPAAGENPWGDLRGERFRHFLTEAGHPCAAIAPRGPEGVAAWLRGLPRPVGVMAWNDDAGQVVLTACRDAGLRLPEEVAVVGADNDELVCNLSDPPLSSVDLGAERAGYEAAALLDGMMAGAGPPPMPVFLPPRGVVARQSSDVLAVDDEDLARVVRYLREHACEGVGVAEAFRLAGRSYSTLKGRFKALLGRTPKQELVRVQMERAKGLLAATDLPVVEVAERCGFSSAKRFFEAFAAKAGMTPGAYRRRCRGE